MILRPGTFSAAQKAVKGSSNQEENDQNIAAAAQAIKDDLNLMPADKRLENITQFLSATFNKNAQASPRLSFKLISNIFEYAHDGAERDTIIPYIAEKLDAWQNKRNPPVFLILDNCLHFSHHALGPDHKDNAEKIAAIWDRAMQAAIVVDPAKCYKKMKDAVDQSYRAGEHSTPLYFTARKWWLAKQAEIRLEQNYLDLLPTFPPVGDFLHSS